LRRSPASMRFAHADRRVELGANRDIPRGRESLVDDAAPLQLVKLQPAHQKQTESRNVDESRGHANRFRHEK
jgi:hypothetical protein